jgi:predicted CopG family antitoxin
MYVTIAVRPDTYRELAEIKRRLGFKSYDDVVKILLSCYIKSAKAGT